TEKRIGRALIQMTTQGSVCHVKLKKAVTRCQSHFVELADIPCIDDDPARIGIVPERKNRFADLVNCLSFRGRPTSPLLAINRSEIPVFIRPFIPYAHAVLVQIANVCIPLQEPQEFINDRLQMQLFGCAQRKSFTQIKPHLMAEDADRPRTRPVRLLDAIVKNMLKEIEVLLHVRGYCHCSYGMNPVRDTCSIQLLAERKNPYHISQNITDKSNILNPYPLDLEIATQS